MELIQNNILSFIIFFPMVVALCIAPMKSAKSAQLTALLGSLAVFVAACFVWCNYDPSKPSHMDFVQICDWIPAFGIKYIVGVDGISLLLLVLTAFLVPLIIISRWDADDAKNKAFLALFMALESGMMGALLSLDMVLFYIFWEAMLIPMYFIIGIWGGKRRIYATTKFVIYTVVGSLLMLAAAIVLYHMYTAQFPDAGPSTALADLYKVKMNDTYQYWLYAAFALAFAIKVPMFPFHTWLPDAHVEAPTAGSVILAGILLKMGTYGFLRFALPLFPQAAFAFAPLIMSLGVIGIIYGALTAWMQTDAKKLVAYSSVSHLGFVVIGSMAFLGGGEGLSPEALTGAVYQMINHGISTGALFFLVGVIYERRHTRMLSDYGGLASVMPWFSIMLIVATLSSVGLPGTGGFVGEVLILIGTFNANPLAGAVASLGVLLGAIYMLTLCKKILFGPLDNEENKQLKDLSIKEFVYLTPLAILAIVMGVYPKAFLEKARPSISYLAKNYSEYRLTGLELEEMKSNKVANR